MPGNGIEFGLRESREIGTLGKILAKQAAGIFVDAALPRAVQIGEIDRDASDFGKARMLRHLAPLVVGQGKASLRIDPVEDSAKGSGRGFGRGVLHLDQGDEERGPLDQRADGRALRAPLIRSPSQWPGMKRSSISGGRRWMLVISGIWPWRSSPWARSRRSTCAQSGPSWASREGQTCGPRQRTGALLRERHSIAACDQRTPAFPGCRGRIAPAVAVQFTTDRTWRAALLKPQLDHRALFTTQVFVFPSHRNALPLGK